MFEFEVEDPDAFRAGEALVRTLQLLAQIIVEVLEFRWTLIPTEFHEAVLEPAQIALEDIEALADLVAATDFETATADEFRLRGPALRWKMLLIRFAAAQMGTIRPVALQAAADGRRERDAWGFYRKTIAATLSAIDGPLESLTKMLGAKEGVVEFKKGLEFLLRA